MRTYKKVARGAEFPEPSAMQKYGAPRDGRKHVGFDIANGKPFDVSAFDAGPITKRPYNSTAGYSVWIHHANGSKTLYSHLTKASYDKLKNGQWVKEDEVFAVAGRTGNATGIVLHLEIWPTKNSTVDPEPHILDNDEMKTGKPMPSIGQVQVKGGPELINDAGNKSGAFAGPNAVIPFDAIRTSKFTDGGHMIEFHNAYTDKGSVWVHSNDLTKDKNGNPIILWGHVEPEKKIAKIKEYLSIN